MISSPYFIQRNTKNRNFFQKFIGGDLKENIFFTAIPLRGTLKRKGLKTS
jgi:hypothetical protein